MKIIIATGIYPPEVGGPAYYARGLEKSLGSAGHVVRVVTYGWIKKLPTGIRHVIYFFRLLAHTFSADVIISLDMFSVGFPAVLAGKMLRVPVVVRTGGDFLWEFYVERTGEKILLSDFYKKDRNFILKEKIIFKLTRFVLRNAGRIVFSTMYQRDIFISAYNLNTLKTHIIENYYGSKEFKEEPSVKNFVCFTRDLVWKNIDTLERAFNKAKDVCPGITLETGMFSSRKEYLEKIKTCYAVVLISLGDISPNMILDALQHGKPFILTNENGLTERLKDVGIFVDPLSVDEVSDAICSLADDRVYAKQQAKLQDFSFIHTYDDIAQEFLTLIKNL